MPSLTVKVGEGATADVAGAVAGAVVGAVFSGGGGALSLTQNNNTAAVKLDLLSPTDGSCVWRSEALLRELPRGSGFENTIRKMLEYKIPRR